MKKIVRITFNAITCILCWLTISPLFYYLAGRWKLKRGRLFLMLISPLFLIGYLTILIWGYLTYLDYERKYYFADEDRIERITSIRFPDMDIVEYNKGKTSFTRDYRDELLVEFEDVPSKEFYQTLDSLIEYGNTDWEKKNDVYIFNITWGNGISAPKGESKDEDRWLSILFKKGSKRATIHSGMW